MARNKFGLQLRKRIVDDYSNGMSQKEITEKYKIHKSSVSRIVNQYKATKTVSVIHRGGRPRHTSQRTDNLIVQTVKKQPFITSSQLVKDLQLPIAARSVRRRLVDASLRAHRPAKKPLISKRNQLKRLKFARDHLNWPISKWKTVLFSDESKFNIIGSDGLRYVRRPSNMRLKSQYCTKTVKHGGGSAMVWGCFSANGVGPIHRIDGIMDQHKYKDILNDVMLPYSEWEMPLAWVFQHDNDPKHTSRVVKSWLAEKNITVMEWPPQSPDLNPIENLWEIVNQRIDRNNVRNTNELFINIKEAWSSIPATIINNLIASMPRRCAAVIKNSGFATKY